MTFNQYIENIGQEKWEFLFKNGKRSSELNGHNFQSLCYSSFRFIKETAPDLIKQGEFEKLIYKCFIDRKIFIFEIDIQYFNFNECLYFLFWIIDELKYWNEMEVKHLSSEPDFDMIAAGLNELNIFGDLNTIDVLAGGDPLKWELIKDLPYQTIFDKQLKSIKEAKFQKKYQKVMSAKNKSKSKTGH